MIIVVTPPFEARRNGIFVLHKLYESLRQAGVETHLVFFTNPRSGKFFLSNDPLHYGPVHTTGKIPATTREDLARAIANGVVIYPEIISGNPLKAPRVCRYMLNREGALQGNALGAQDNDLIILFSKIFGGPGQVAPVLHYPTPLDWAKALPVVPLASRTIDLFYVGKADRYDAKVHRHQPPNTLEVTRHWPKTQQEFRALLGVTRFFFSCDTLSAVNAEAAIAGAIPVVMGLGPFSLANLEASEYGFLKNDYNFYSKPENRLLSPNLLTAVKTYQQSLISTTKYFEDRWPDSLRDFLGLLDRRWNLRLLQKDD